MSLRVRKNDSVLILSGNHKGKKGKVLKVFPNTNRIIVEGVNLIKRHTRVGMGSSIPALEKIPENLGKIN